MRLCRSRERRLACQALKGGGNIDQASVEENPTICSALCDMGGKRECDGRACDMRPPSPTATPVRRRRLLADDPTAGFFHRDIAASDELGQQR